MDHLIEVIKECFPDSKVSFNNNITKYLKTVLWLFLQIAGKISCKRTKAAAITKNVIGKIHKEGLVQKLKTTKFSVMIDESTDVSTNKAMCVVVRFYDNKQHKIVSRFFDLIDIFQDGVEIATAEVIYEALIKSFTSVGVPTINIIGFGSDGCNTMMGKNNSVMSRFLENQPGIFISKCICHSLHLCASEAAKQLPRRCEDLARDVFSYFKNSAKRKAIFLTFQEFANVKPHKLLAPSQTRWLSLHAVVNRLLEQWHALQLFFAEQAFTERLASADRVVSYLNDPQVKLFYLFLDWVLPKFNKLNAYFQSEKCIISTVHTKMSDTYLELLRAFLNEVYITANLNDIDPYKESAQLSNNNLYLGFEVIGKLADIRKTMENNVANELENDFKNRCRQFLQVSCQQIRKRFDFGDTIMSKLSLVNPETALSKNNNCSSLAHLCALLPKCAEGLNKQSIDDEWRQLRFYDFSEKILHEKSTDIFWSNVKNIRNDEDIPLFYNISTFFLNILSLPHSNADCERIFSSMNLLKTKLRNALHISSVSHILLAKECIKEQGGCTNFVPCKTMLAANNNNIYACIYPDSEHTDQVTMEKI